MPEIPDPPPSQPAFHSAESASPSLLSQHHGDEASVRLLLEAPVSRWSWRSELWGVAGMKASWDRGVDKE
jgi:hypothetical protein